MICSIIRANEKDGVAMLELMEQAKLGAPIEIMLTRRPDAFSSYKKECRDAEVFLVKFGDEIVLEIACLFHELSIDGNFARAGYICGLRKKEGFLKIDYKKLAQTIFNECKCDIYYANILDINVRALKILAKGHKALPPMHPVCRYSLFVFRPVRFKSSKSSKSPDGNCFRGAVESDYPSIEKFLYGQRKGYDFFPAFDFKQFADMNIRDFYILEQNDEILCVCALWRQEGFKQYIVRRYNGILKILSVLPIFPKAGEIQKNPVLTYFVAKDDRQEHYREMLKQINAVMLNKFAFYTIGAAHSSELYKVLSKKTNAARFDSTVYTVDFENKNSVSPNGKIHIEGGFL